MILALYIAQSLEVRGVRYSLVSIPTILFEQLKPKSMIKTPSAPRIEVVDALRGFAILSIMLLHNIEHFDFYFFPDFLPQWLKAVDGGIWKTLFFLFGGKSYAIFAILFGLTFHIQLSNQQSRGGDFRARFAWRLILLLGFGVFNSLFYQGDILCFYAILGFALIPVCRLKDGVVLATALFFLSQPVEWIRFFQILSDPAYVPASRYSDYYFPLTLKGFTSNSFFDLVAGNIQVGKLAVISWFIEYGRVMQTVGLFMVGMLIGRKGLFGVSDVNLRFWKRTLLTAAIIFFPLFFLKDSLGSFVSREVLIEPLALVIGMWSNVAFTAILISSFVLAYQLRLGQRVLSKLIPIGKMTLTNYIMQSMVGSFIYYEYGFGLYKYTGATFCLLIGVALISLQIVFCKWWLKSHKHGPLETLWHKGTWIGTDR